MTRSIPGPNRNPTPPRLALPPNATDAHCHIFGPAHRFPFAATRSYTPPDSGLEEFQDLQQTLGLSRAVFVQASCHGTDNRAMLDALDRGAGRYAGVAMIDPTHSTEQLRDMHVLGVRGIRFNFVEHLGGPPDLDWMWHAIDRVAELGWHVELHFDARDLPKQQALLDRMPVPYLIDHMARVDATAGTDQEPFQALLTRLKADERAWVKISGAERLTAGGVAPYDDVVPFARALVECAPDRVLWGTDWPHPNVRSMPDDGNLVDLLVAMVPDDDLRRRILVDNPGRLYEFTA